MAGDTSSAWQEFSALSHCMQQEYRNMFVQHLTTLLQDSSRARPVLGASGRSGAALAISKKLVAH